MKIPQKAKRVFKGVIFEVYQWQQPMYDGSTATFEALKRPSTLGILPIVDDGILIGYEEQPSQPPTLTLFGGRLEEGEEPLEGAKRELLEESGYTSNDWELYKTYEFEGKIEWTDYLYIARNCKKIAEPEFDGGEKIEIHKVSFEEFITKVTHEKFSINKDFLIDIFRIKEDPNHLEELRSTLWSTS